MRKPLSRRSLLGGAALAAQVATAPGQQRARAGRKFRALVRYGTGASVQELTLLPIQPREVVVRTQASAVCYTIVGQVLSKNNAMRASIPNHSGMGVVEEVGPLVKRVQPRDRVILPGTPHCGQ